MLLNISPLRGTAFVFIYAIQPLYSEMRLSAYGMCDYLCNTPVCEKACRLLFKSWFYKTRYAFSYLLDVGVSPFGAFCFLLFRLLRYEMRLSA